MLNPIIVCLFGVEVRVWMGIGMSGVGVGIWKNEYFRKLSADILTYYAFYITFRKLLFAWRFTQK